MNSRIKEPKSRIFEREIKYGSGISGMADSIDGAACCMTLNIQHCIKPYMR